MPDFPKLADLIDVSALQSLMDDFYRIAGIPMSVVDTDGRVLVGVGWQEVCTRFHRVHPETCQACTESDTELAGAIEPGESKLYRCKNNMWDAATPLMVGDRRVGNVFSGQFFFDDEAIDYESFRRQAQRYGFDEVEYLGAVARVPRLSRERLERGLAFFKKLAQTVSRLADANVTLARTVGERDALTSELTDNVRRLDEANRLKDEFLSTLSHELRTPLTAVIGWTQLLLSGSIHGDMRTRALEAIDRNAKAQLALVNDVLDVARVVSGKLRLDVQETDIAPCLDAALDAVRPAAAAKRIAVGTTIEGHSPVMADPDRLQQVLWNLLSNTVKFTPAGGRVDVRLRQVGELVEVSVHDTGVGIAKEFLPHVFDRFRQADGSSTRTHSGLGLGLAIVRHLVELHGGEVRADSEGRGRGAVFTVALPAVSAAAAARRHAIRAPREGRSEQGPTPGSLQGTRVLVLDDEQDARELLAVLLRGTGAAVRCAASADEALEIVGPWRPHVIVCDIAMPDVDGYGFLRQLRALPADRGATTPALALTAHASPEDRLHALAAGFVEHVAKPVDPEALIAALSRLSPRAVV